MADTTPSPNMNMPIPTTSVDPGPDWANNVNSSLLIVDAHDHTPGKGVAITPDALNINADLPMNNHNLTGTKSVTFQANGSPLATLLAIYASGQDLYYTDGAGNQVRITQGGTVTGSTGTITGLPSGTASASFAGSAFTFQSATNTPAIMNVGPLVIGANTASPKTVTLGTSASQPSNYNLTFPLAAPANNQVLQSDGSGNFAWARIFGDVYTPSISFSHVSGGTGTFTVSSASGIYSRINNFVSVYVLVGFTINTAVGGGAFYNIQATVPITPNTLTGIGTVTSINNASNDLVTGILGSVSNTAVISTSAVIFFGGTGTGTAVFNFGYNVN